MDANWQWLSHIIAFMSVNDPSYYTYLDETSAFFKPTSLTMEKLERKSVVHYCINRLNNCKEENEEDEEEEADVPTYVLLALVGVLENTRDQELWSNLNRLDEVTLRKLINRAIYPIVWFKSPSKVLKNK